MRTPLHRDYSTMVIKPLGLRSRFANLSLSKVVAMASLLLLTQVNQLNHHHGDEIQRGDIAMQFECSACLTLGVDDDATVNVHHDASEHHAALCFATEPADAIGITPFSAQPRASPYLA